MYAVAGLARLCRLVAHRDITADMPTTLPHQTRRCPSYVGAKLVKPEEALKVGGRRLIKYWLG